MDSTTPPESTGNHSVYTQTISLLLSSTGIYDNDTLANSSLSSESTNLTSTGTESVPSSLGTTPFQVYGQPTYPLTIKDRTMLVTLVVMGIIVPAVFIFVIAAICVKRKKYLRHRRSQMLLKDTQEVAMEDLPY